MRIAIRQRLASLKASEERKLSAFRVGDGTPLEAGEWACPLCHLVGRESRADEHYATRHPVALKELQRFERSITPHPPRAHIIPSGAVGSGGKRR